MDNNDSTLKFYLSQLNSATLLTRAEEDELTSDKLRFSKNVSRLTSSSLSS